MKTLWFACLVMMAAPSAQAEDIILNFANGAVQARCAWTQGPQSSGESKMSIEWKNGADQTSMEAPGPFTVALFMPDMGHGSAPTQIKSATDKNGAAIPGAYEVSGMYFVMAGKWQVNLTLMYPNGNKETQTIDVDVPGSMHHGHRH